MKSLSLLFLFATISFYSNAQKDTVVIYTKKGCSKCAFTKDKLSKENIFYVEKGLEDKTIGREMLSRIKKANYHDRIFLPVIFIKDSLLHPWYEVVDTTKEFVNLRDVVGDIISRKGTLAIRKQQTIADSKTETQPTAAECEEDTKRHYIVCLESESEDDAKAITESLKSDGFPNSGFVMMNNTYRIYLDYFFEFKDANLFIKREKDTFEMLYMLKL
jgi:glutaredoxin